MMVDKPISNWGTDAAGRPIKNRLPVLPQEEIDQIESRYLREVYQEARDKALKEAQNGK